MQIIHAARRIAFVGTVAAMAATASAAAAEAAVIHGTVVHRNSHAHSFAVADRAGRLYAIHAAHSPRPGTVVSVAVRRLRNGTYAARWTHVGAYRPGVRVRLRGTVSYLDLRHGTFTLSARGISMLVRAGRAHRARLADALERVGTIVTATGTVDDQGDLNEDAVQSDGTDTGAIDLEGTILAIDTTAGTITLSSTDDDETSGSIVVDVPSTLDISMFTVGEEVELTVTQQPDGTYLLAGAASDEGAQGANDQADQQGDQDPGDQGDAGSSGSDTGSSGSDAASSGSDAGSSGSDAGSSGSDTGSSSDN
jgi:hypothetical protein